MTTLYSTFNWKSFATRIARAIEEGDTDGIEDWAKDFRLFEDVPCPSIAIGGPRGGEPVGYVRTEVASALEAKEAL
jgi:hypothetical protein